MAALMPACGMPWELFQRMSGVPSAELKNLARYNWLKRSEVGDQDWISMHSIVAELVGADMPPSMGDDACRGFALAMGDWLAEGMPDRTPLEVLRAADTAARSAELALREQTDEGVSRIVVPYVYALNVAGSLDRALAAAEGVDPSGMDARTTALVDLEAATVRANMLKQSEDGVRDVIARLERYRPEDRVSLSRAHELLASLCIMRMDMKSAKEQLDAALDAADDLSIGPNRGISVLINIAMLNMMSGDQEEMMVALETAMELYREHPSREFAGLGMMCDFIDGIGEDDERSDEEIAEALMGAVIKKRITQLPEDHPYIVIMGLGEASERIMAGDFEGAQAAIDRAEAAASKNYAPGSTFDLMVKRTRLDLCQASGRGVSDAMDALARSMAAADKGNLEAMSYWLNDRCEEAARLLESGSDDAAVRLMDETVGRMGATADGLFLSGCWGLASKVFYDAAEAEPDRGRAARLYAEARRFQEGALDIDFTGFEARKADVLLSAGIICAKAGDLDAAERHLTGAAELVTDVDDPALYAALVLRQVGGTLLEKGDLVTASDCFERSMGLPADPLYGDENRAICIGCLALCNLDMGNVIAFRGMALDALVLMENTPLEEEDSFDLCDLFAEMFSEREDIAERFRSLAQDRPEP